MNENRTTVCYRKPPRFLPVLLNPLAKTILHSPLHGLMSRQLLLITFTGRKSGKVFTTPAMYEQEGKTLLLRVGYPLVEESAWRGLSTRSFAWESAHSHHGGTW